MNKIINAALLTIALVCAATFYAAAQPKDCKWVKESTDKFTKKESRTAQMAIGIGMLGWQVILQESEGKYYAGMRLIGSGHATVPFPKGKKISFAFESAPTLELTAAEDAPPNHWLMLNDPMTSWVVLAPVTAAEFERLGVHEIIAVKFWQNGTEAVLNGIRPKQTENITKTAACMMGK